MFILSSSTVARSSRQKGSALTSSSEPPLRAETCCSAQTSLSRPSLGRSPLPASNDIFNQAVKSYCTNILK